MNTTIHSVAFSQVPIIHWEETQGGGATSPPTVPFLLLPVGGGSTGLLRWKCQPPSSQPRSHHPGQGLVTTLLNDLHVSDLERDERRWPRIGGKSRLGPAEHNTTSGNKKAQPGRNEVTRLRAKM